MHKILIKFFFILGLGLFIGPSSVFADEDLQAQLKKAQQQSEALLKQLKTFNKSQNKDPQANQAAPSIDDAQTQRMMKKMMKRYQRMDLDAIKGELLQGSQGTKLNKVFRDYPKTLDFMARVYQSDTALSRAMEMRSDMDKLKKVGFFMLGTFVISFILGKIMVTPSMGFTRRIFMGFSKAMIIWCLRLGIIVYFYGYYLSPMWDIFYQVFIESLLINKA